MSNKPLKPFKVRLECMHKIPVVNPNNGKTMLVGCGKCPVCRMKRSNGWFVRLRKELEQSSSAWFITLTYDDEHLPYSEEGIATFDKRDIQLMMKRIRKEFSKKENNPIRYFICSEYGPSTFRPHYHGIVFGLPFNYNQEREFQKWLSEKWECGYVSVGPVTSRRIKYTVKYCTAQTFLPEHLRLPFYRPFLMCSKGLGKCYLTEENKLYHNITLNTEVMIDGFNYSMPRYYRTKIFNELVREMLSELYEEEYEEYIKEYMRRYHEYDNGRWYTLSYNPDPNIVFSGKKGEVYVQFCNKVYKSIKGGKNKI